MGELGVLGDLPQARAGVSELGQRLQRCVGEQPAALLELVDLASRDPVDPLGRVHVAIHGNSNYKQTGLLQAYAAYSLLQQPPKRAGFASACQAFGHRELLGVLRNFGLVLKPIVTVHD